MTISKTFKTEAGEAIECVDLNDAFEKGGSKSDQQAAAKLLANVHAGIYNDAFPIPCEQESLEYWMGNLQAGREEGQQLLSVFGKDLDSQNPQIMGFICSRVLADSNCALVDYIIRVKEYDNTISGAEICSHAEKGLNDLNNSINGQPLKAIFWEVNDPAKVEWNENDPNRFENDCMDPAKRIKIISGPGYEAEETGFDFVQGPLDECSTQQEINDGVCDTLKLYKLKSEKYNQATAEDAKKFVIRYNMATNGSSNPRELNNEAMITMLDQLDVMIAENIPLMKKQQTKEHRSLIENASEIMEAVAKPVVDRSKKIQSVRDRMPKKAEKPSPDSGSSFRHNVEKQINPAVKMQLSQTKRTLH
ncbi:MAG: hypothetical protein LBR70_01255 [Lactobacillaceae bacterium]|jgi:hypothetical protein|nr:hypothetical protein [Lactobacillaceae bacterium]